MGDVSAGGEAFVSAASNVVDSVIVGKDVRVRYSATPAVRDGEGVSVASGASGVMATSRSERATGVRIQPNFGCLSACLSADDRIGHSRLYLSIVRCEFLPSQPHWLSLLTPTWQVGMSDSELARTIGRRRCVGNAFQLSTV